MAQIVCVAHHRDVTGREKAAVNIGLDNLLRSMNFKVSMPHEIIPLTILPHDEGVTEIRKYEERFPAKEPGVPGGEYNVTYVSTYIGDGEHLNYVVLSGEDINILAVSRDRIKEYFQEQGYEETFL